MNSSTKKMSQPINLKLTLMILFLIVLLDQAGLVLIAPIFPQLLASLTHLPTESNAIWMGFLIASYALMQFLFAPIVGRLSDRFGRKPILLICMLAFVFDYILMAVTQSIYVLFIGRIISGITGASITVAMASIADISDEKNRMNNFGVVYAAMGIGLILGPIVGGIGGGYGLRIPFWSAAIFSLINFLLVLFLFKETYSPKSVQKKAVTGTFLSSYRRIITYPNVKGLLLAQFIVLIGFNGAILLWPYFTEIKYHWSPEYIGYSLAIIGIGLVLVQIFVVRIANHIFGDKNSVLIGLLLYTVSSIMLAVISNEILMLLLVIIPYCLGSISNSAASSILVSRVPDDQQGELQGVVASINSITLIISPILMSFVFKYSVQNNIGFKEGNLYLIIGLLFSLTFCIYYYTLRNVK